MAFGEDKVGATSELGVAVVDATIEPRRDDGQDAAAIEGDRLWLTTGSEVRAYDLGTRQLAAHDPAARAPSPSRSTATTRSCTSARAPARS